MSRNLLISFQSSWYWGETYAQLPLDRIELMMSNSSHAMTFFIDFKACLKSIVMHKLPWKPLFIVFLQNKCEMNGVMDV